jgi:hypothetical protein
MHAGSDANTSQYDSFSTWLGKQCYVRNTFGGYTSWSAIASPSFMSTATKSWLGRGSLYEEVIGIGMCPQPGSQPSSSGVTLSDVAGGAGDTYWTQLGQNIANLGNNPATGKPYANQIVLRLGWEMNGDWYQWGYGTAIKSWNTLSAFIAAWQRIVPLIRAKAPGVRFMWCPTTGRNIDPNNSNGYIASGTGQNYPGDSYVDIVALDVYDQYDTGGWPQILNGGSGVIAGGLKALRTFANAHGKPEAYPEWGLENTSNGNQDNPYFVAGMYFWFNAPGANVYAHAIWNTGSGGPNAAIQGTSCPIITGSISGTTLTIASTSQGTPGKYHYLQTADPVHNKPILPGTYITAGSGSSWTINQSQTVPSQTINLLPVPSSSAMYRLLFGQSASITKIAAKTVGGILMPSADIPKNIACFFDGTYYNVAQV